MNLRQRIARSFVVLAALLGATLGTLLLTSSPAAADRDAFGYEYGHTIDVNAACHLTYGGERQLISAGIDDYTNGFGWYCQRKTGNSTAFGFAGGRGGTEISAEVGSETEILGGVDMQRYCNENHPGTIAMITSRTPVLAALNWRCYG